MMPTLNSRVAKLEGSMGDVRETLEEVEGCIIELKSRQDQLKGQVVKALGVNVDVMQWVLNIVVCKLTKKNDALKASHGVDLEETD
ncbi:hypothetical protein J1N35_012190 [Gossypium stocksii]|uniref:Uncharacterized protein n=1 Tax=Gossypium stocksii TaxID=47602 RepID=A0A9D3W535_9ROSI|nr:hypothetical protein J1N35_012190 [Gossypium stocksii]